MASFKSYLSNNAPFLNAREKWQTAGGEESDARRRWNSAKESDANYEQLLSDYKSAQNRAKAAKAVMDAAETAARKTFDAEQKQKDTKKQKKKEEPIKQQIATLEAEETKYKNAGLEFPAAQQEQLNALRNQITVTPATTTVTGGTTGTAGTTTGSTPVVLSFEEFIKGVDSDPKLLAKVRADLGIKSTDPKLDIATYQALIRKEQDIVTLEGIRGPIDRLTYYAETRGTGTGAGATTSISPRADATVYINNAFKRAGINREATPQEIDSLYKVLNDAENRFKTTKSGGVTKDLLGDRTQFITNLITTGKYVDPNTGKPIKGLDAEKFKDVREAAKVLGTLSKSAQTLKADTRSLTTQTLQSTANANGITLSPQQLDQYALDIQNGKDVKIIQNQIRSLAGLGMPDNVKKLLAEGTDLDTIYSPYRKTMAAVLEIPEDSISLADPTLRKAIGSGYETVTAQPGMGGVSRGEYTMTLYDFQKALRKDPRWQYTDNAKADVFQSIKEVFGNFGIMEI